MPPYFWRAIKLKFISDHYHRPKLSFSLFFWAKLYPLHPDSLISISSAERPKKIELWEISLRLVGQTYISLNLIVIGIEGNIFGCISGFEMHGRYDHIPKYLDVKENIQAKA